MYMCSVPTLVHVHVNRCVCDNGIAGNYRRVQFSADSEIIADVNSPFHLCEIVVGYNFSQIEVIL